MGVLGFRLFFDVFVGFKVRVVLRFRISCLLKLSETRRSWRPGLLEFQKIRGGVPYFGGSL